MGRIITKSGKRDYRAWANKHLKPGVFPEPVNGWGLGRKRYCPHCKALTTKTTYKFALGEKGCWCGVCGTKAKEYLPNDYFKLYKWLGKIPFWLWDLLDKWCLRREREYKGVGSGD